MADERDVSRRYRELGGEEPPRSLDDAILAAGRRAVDSRPAPLVAPAGRRRWYFPLAAAAVIVLAVAVTVHVEREQPAEEVVSVAAQKAPPEAAKAEAAKSIEEQPAAAKPQPAPPPVFAPDPIPKALSVPAPASSPPREMRDQPGRQDEMLAQERARAETGAQAMRRQSAGVAAPGPVVAASQAADLAKLAQQSPEQWLLGIDDLKRQGRHEEAEKQLAEFRKRYPDYRIPEAISEKFEKR